ncbi:MAG TPA: hydroxymethylglutaryl-CoA reductase [Thermoanaerobaculia bacterium]|jgi:hydroxymethylglutaryl-CoA reductase (NADPH)|nr:hydroxymethylglutaryl-CoA reductase [Thermoanaerobaculia bacterium]
MSDLIPRFNEFGYSAEGVAARRGWIEQRTGAALRHVGAFTFPAEEMRGKIENPIGAVQMPLGAAGPLRVCGEHAEGIFFVPMATTEGALVRSYERGAMAVTRAGGAHVRLYVDENRISPVFVFAGIAEAAAFARELPERFEALRAEAEATTRHGRLLRVEPFPLGREVMVHFCYSTGDAGGMNMIARATDRVCRWLVEQSAALRFYLFAALDSEKHASSSLFFGGKGKKAVAGVRLPASLVRNYLGSTPEQILELWHTNVLAQLHAGASTCNAHLANGLAALFIACGQDVANIVNASVGILRFDIEADGALFASVTLPSLTVATVGGGTQQGTSRECLEMLGCLGDGKAPRFAEIAAAFLLAGEISLMAAIASGELVAAHEAYGRNRPGG